MADRWLAWLSAGVLTAGVSAATIAGAGSATAEDGATPGAGADTTSEAADPTGAEEDSEDQETEAEVEVDETDPADDEKPTDDGADGEGAEHDEEDEEVDEPRTGHRSARDDARDDEETADDSASLQSETDDSGAEDEDTAEEAKAEQGSQPAEHRVAVTEAAASEAPAEPVAESKEPNVVETITTAVSSVVSTLLSPFASNTAPETPAAQPQMLTLMAAARREFETAFESPSLEVQVGPVENSLTYTSPPTSQDQLTLAFYEVMRVVSKVTGVNTTIALGRVLATGTPPFFVGFGLDTQRTVWTAEDGTQWRVWEFHPPNPTDKTVLAFHGGGLFEPTIVHWLDYTNMARETGATVVVPLFPLYSNPEGAAKEVIPEAADFISDQIAAHGPGNVSVYGDSGGSLIAMSAVRQLLLTGRPVPSSLVFVGLPADYSSSNPDIRNIDDPLYDIDNLDAWVSHWLDGITDRQDPLVSPLFFEPEVLKALPQTTLYVGTREILYPDTLLLHQRAVDEGAPISVVVGVGLIHGWTLAGAPIPTYSQTVAVRPDVYRQLGLTADAAVDAVTNLQAAEEISTQTAFEAPSLVEQAVPVENSLTYIPLSFQDRIAVMVQESLSLIKKFTGIDAFATLGGLMATRTPPFFLTFGLHTERTVWTADDGTEWEVWEFARQTPTDKTVVAFHGGGFIYEPSILNWIDYTNMVRNTGATVVVPLYPLATGPGGTARQVVPDAANFISDQIELRGAENVSIYADSAGTAISMSAVRELLLAGKPVPSHMVMLSMLSDASLENPDIREVDDPIFDLDDLGAWDSLWFDGVTDRRDPFYSPLHIEPEIFKALPPTTIYVGEREILYPDTLLLHQRAVDEGVPISVVVGEGLLHGWPISGLPLYSATAKTRPNVYRQLGLTEEEVV